MTKQFDGWSLQGKQKGQDLITHRLGLLTLPRKPRTINFRHAVIMSIKGRREYLTPPALLSKQALTATCQSRRTCR